MISLSTMRCIEDIELVDYIFDSTCESRTALEFELTKRLGAAATRVIALLDMIRELKAELEEYKSAHAKLCASSEDDQE